jgi:hypothetical protein
MRTTLVLLGSLLAACAAAGAEQPKPTPAPDGPPAAETRKQPFSLDLNRLINEQSLGHAEFNPALRREIWGDPMTRLAYGVSREEAAARRGGFVGYSVPFSATGVLATYPGADPRLVLSGPFASDWSELSTQEKFGRAAETAVYYGIIFELLRGMH